MKLMVTGKSSVSAVCLALLVMFSGGTELLSATGPAQGPDVRFDQPVYDFRFAGQNKEIVHRFPFSNIGPGALTITAVKSSCACQTSVRPLGSIAPGGKGVIEVTCKTGRRIGQIREVVSVLSNDPNKPEIRLEVIGTVKADFALDPEFLHFGAVERGDTPLKSIRLIDVGDRHLVLHRVEAPEQYLFTHVSPIKEGPIRGFLIEVVLKPDAPLGRFAVPMTLHTNLPRRPRMDVLVTGNVLRPKRDDPNQSVVEASVHERALDRAATPDPNGKRPEVVKPAAKTRYVTRPPTEEDTYVAAWLIKRFLDPNAEFSFVSVDADVPEDRGIVFDLPSPRARWMRSHRGCTSEQILADTKDADATVKIMVAYVRQLEMASWLVSANSDAGRLRAWMRKLNTGQSDPETRLMRACEFLDGIYQAGGKVP